MLQRFEGKAALITGAGSGIGRATALRLVAEGAAVLGVDVDGDGLDETATAAGEGRFVAHRADLSQPEACKEAVATCVEELGGLDVLGNVAGILLAAHMADVTVEQYRRVMAVNLDACFFLSQAALPHLLERGGNIVNVASNAGLIGIPYGVVYAMSKGGVVQLTRSLAGTQTRLTATAQFPPDVDPRLMARMAGHRGMAEPEEVASLFAFLASGEARSITGSIYTIDNGLTAS
jgi:meso-butanediol dehydrogenase/(S,S)-butanediol dehydrogenase/diacetyl reductase